MLPEGASNMQALEFSGFCQIQAAIRLIDKLFNMHLLGVEEVLKHGTIRKPPN